MSFFMGVKLGLSH